MNELKQLSNKVNSIDSAQKMLENQVAQSASTSQRPLGTLLGQPKQNPKGQISAITLRSGKQIQREVEPMKVQDEENDVPLSNMNEPSSSGCKEGEPSYTPPPPYRPPLPFPQRKNHFLWKRSLESSGRF